MRKKVWALAVATALMTTLFATAAVATVPWETEDLVGQGLSGPVVSEDGGMILRAETYVWARVKMPTPVPGEYEVPPKETYPTSSGEEGSPAAFSLWVFIFFNPEACDAPCDGADLQTNPAVVAGGYNAGGHVVDGGILKISGKVDGQSRTFGGPNAESIAEALDMGLTIEGAEIHLAVAPHGKEDPALGLAQIRTPAGNVDFWWIAQFK